ncbi:MAG: T9SS type A sorting domain-containing protein [Candidatus Kapaibacteriota bacterium]
MTKVRRFLLCLSAALPLCCAILSAQQPTPQRFLRFLGQRSGTTGTFLPTVEPFRAGVPTTASLVFAITDREGRVLRDDSTIVFLSLLGQNSDWAKRESYFALSDSCVEYGDACFSYTITCKQSPIPARASAGIVEYAGLQISGKARTNAILLCSSATIQQTTLTVSLIGGKTRWFRFETLKNGKLTVPGKVFYNDLFAEYGTELEGTSPFIEVGKPIILSSDTTDYQYITVRAVDSWNNDATFSTTVTINAFGQHLINNPWITVFSYNQVVTDPLTGLAIFKDLRIIGATSSNVSLYFTTNNLHFRGPIDVPRTSATLSTSVQSLKDAALLTCSFASPSSYGVTLMPGPAVAVAPRIIPDIYDAWSPGQFRFNRMPTRFTIGKSNADDPRTWFYLYAVDQFGNAVDNGPNTYNGGTATIRFASPEEGLPRSSTDTFQFSASNDPYVRANSQRFAATGTSAVAVNGLYTFNNFMPIGSASRSTTDTVILTFEDPALKGFRVPPLSSIIPWAMYFSRPTPPITTATTIFLQPTSIATALPDDAARLSITPNPASDIIRIGCILPENAPILVQVDDMLGRTVLRHEESSALQGVFATTLDVSHFPQGAYTLHVRSGRGRWAARLLVVH